MNKNAIKKFAMAARTRLIATVSDRAGMLGITKDKISQPKSKGNGFEIYETAAGTENTLNRNQIHQRKRLVEQIEARGFDVVVEEIAYTWFNRICAIRFMEVNDYLPSRVRALSSLREGKNEPDLLTEAPNVDLDFTDQEREWILAAKEQNRLDELFSMLFIKQCNKLSEILPELFEATEDYTEMLLSLSYTNKDDVIRMLVDGVDEEDFNVSTPDEDGNPTGQVEIIGWLYQYYNTELKDDTFAQLKKNVKISKERIPAATQLFTPDWIVRYMVENSVGRIWIEHLRAVDPSTDEKETAEKFGWKYYLPEAEQEPEVSVKLAEIRKSYESLKPEDILCIDPCMGSGHIIVAQFDVLMDIYTSVGYGEREAAFEIVEHNLHGLDIDKRAYQLAYFAVMMKGRQYNRRFFRGKDGMLPKPKVYAFSESNAINRAHLKYFGADLNELEKGNALNQMNGLLDTFKDAREYGSILNVENYDWALLRRFIQHDSVPDQMTLDVVGIEETKKHIASLIDLGEVMDRKYDVVVTNPPYMSSSGMNKTLSKYIKKEYADAKSDLYAVFIDSCRKMQSANGILSMITMQSWMFIGSFEQLRRAFLSESVLLSLLQLGIKAFEEIGNDVVQTVAFCSRKSIIEQYKGCYHKLTTHDRKEKQKLFFERNMQFYANQEKYFLVDGCPVAYWMPDALAVIFKTQRKIGQIADAKIGVQTGNNELFVRFWPEVNRNDIFYVEDEIIGDKQGKWFPYTKGGSYRKWYGNNELVVLWENKGEEIRKYNNFGNINDEFYFRPCITWGLVSSAGLNFRYVDDYSHVIGNGGPMLRVGGGTIEMNYYLLGLLNSCVMQYITDMLNPTINMSTGTVSSIPVLVNPKTSPIVVDYVKRNIALCKMDYDEQEMSIEYKKHPMVGMSTRVEDAFLQWKRKCDIRWEELKKNEEAINSIFISEYGLYSELSSSVKDKYVSVARIDSSYAIKTLISYSVGCMFGRYSLGMEGLMYAGGEWDLEQYSAYKPDKDNIIPITDEEFFDDDIVGRFCQWLKIAFGAETLEENLDYIAGILGFRGDSSREAIRYYFINDFFKDHCSTYSVFLAGRRPIYWLFDSGKQNGFKALIYLHRYNQDTVGRVRTDYLHKTQKAIEHAMQSAQYTLDNSKGGTEKSKATRRIAKYTKQLAEIQLYDEAIAHVANQRVSLNLDDGVKMNYAKFQGVAVAREGMKTVKVDLLAKI